MELKEVLKALGADRVIWIDDTFKKSPNQLADLLFGRPEIAAKCDDAEIAQIAETIEYDSEDARHRLRQLVQDMKPDAQAALSARFFEEEAKAGTMPTPELQSTVVNAVCSLLSIQDGDRWTFDDARSKVESTCASDDAAVSYIIDLNEAGGNDKEGIEVLKSLQRHGSKGTAFLLTHAVEKQHEADKEQELQIHLVGPDEVAHVPVCVISKGRLSEAAGDDEATAAALRIAIKRAGLRRSVHEVLKKVRPGLEVAFKDVAKKLLEIPPEQLDEFVVERGFVEGMSELHVVERAITAQVSQMVRQVFASDPSVLVSTARLRTLRAVSLAGGAAPQLHQHLDGFRRMEVWESDELINKSFSPLACGDIFETDAIELPAGGASRRFLLLGQPCDISLRGERDRDQDSALLIPLKKQDPAAATGENKPKMRALQFKVDGEQWECDFRNATSARLAILDLASFREDGRVRFDAGQEIDIPLLAGLKKVIEERVKPAHAALTGQEPKPYLLQLCFRSNAPFNQVHHGVLESPKQKSFQGVNVDLPKRVTWRLRRAGRIRMPYAAALLRDYLSVQGRDAFDLDFTKERGVPAPTCAPPASQIS